MEESESNQPWLPVMVAHRLAAVRRALGMNRASFADRIGIDRSSYTKIEKGEKPLPMREAFRIYELYGIDMNFIYLGKIGGLPLDMSNRLMVHLANDIE